MTRSRLLYYDILRFAAAFLVVVNHTSAYYLKLGDGSAVFTLYYVAFLISKVAVPIFFMITGAILFQRETPPLQFYLKRIPRVLVPFLLVSLLFWLYKNGFAASSLLSFPKALGDGIATPLWFVYTLLGLYLVLPFLGYMVRKMSERDFRVFFAVFGFLLSAMPLITHYTGFSLNWFFTLPLFPSSVAYAVAGYYLSKKTLSRRASFAAIAIAAAAVAAGVVMLLAECDATGAVFLDSIVLPTTLIPSVCVFLAVKSLLGDRQSGKLASALGDTSYAIYLIHCGLLYVLPTLVAKLFPVMTLLSVVIVQLALFAVSAAAALILKRIPFVNKFI